MPSRVITRPAVPRGAGARGKAAGRTRDPRRPRAEQLRHEPTAGWAFHEFIAGPLATSFGRPRPVDWGLNPRTLFALGGVDNFGHVENDARGLTVKIVDAAGAVRFARTVPPGGPAPR